MRAICFAAVLSALTMSVLNAAGAATQDITVQNTARFLGNGRYAWRVFVVADPAVLGRIAYVEYTLHPTFPNPVRRVTNATDGFALAADGWGEFNILVKVVFQDGRVRQLTHWLSLRTSPPSVPTKPDHANQHGELRIRNTARQAGPGRWDWEIFLEGDEKTLADVRCVTYTLHPSFPDPIRTVCAKGSSPGRGFKLSENGWCTFTVGVEVQFRDGDIRRLSHDLTFGADTSKK